MTVVLPGSVGRVFAVVVVVVGVGVGAILVCVGVVEIVAI